jgi:thiopurine S-methyltransferase
VTADFWLERWREGRSGFDLAAVNPLLVEHCAVFSEATRVLVPLCGKSADLEWLVTQGYEVSPFRCPWWAAVLGAA